jgi:hypothetical protein
MVYRSETAQYLLRMTARALDFFQAWRGLIISRRQAEKLRGLTLTAKIEEGGGGGGLASPSQYRGP